MKRAALTLGIVAIALLPFVASASDTNGTIDSAAKYAWGENLGWVNLAPSGGGLAVTDSVVTGYAWSQAVGWINFSPTNSSQGVTNTTDGVLGGSAWVAGRGWLNMTGITINSSGKFTGTAGTEGSGVGRISFDCDHCDVVTDWRPLSVRTGTTSSSPTPKRSPSSYTAPPTSGPGTNTTTHTAIDTVLQNGGLPPPPHESGPDHVESFNVPLVVLPTQTGLLVYTFSGKVIGEVEVPKGAYGDTLTIEITTTPVAASAYSTSALVLGGVVFDVVAHDSVGNIVHTFNAPLKITLRIPDSLRGQEIGVYWYDDAGHSWTRVPDVTVGENMVSFSVSHLTRFAIFKAAGAPALIPVSSAYLSNPTYLLLALLALILLYYWFVLRHRDRRHRGN